jgi:hypothetical protein
MTGACARRAAGLGTTARCATCWRGRDDPAVSPSSGAQAAPEGSRLIGSLYLLARLLVHQRTGAFDCAIMNFHTGTATAIRGSISAERLENGDRAWTWIASARLSRSASMSAAAAMSWWIPSLSGRRARWKLGQLLAKEERSGGPGRGKKKLSILTSFVAKLKAWGLEKPTAMFAQRIGTLPAADLDAELARARSARFLSMPSRADAERTAQNAVSENGWRC